jgi:hypothetical protein
MRRRKAQGSTVAFRQKRKKRADCLGFAALGPARPGTRVPGKKVEMQPGLRPDDETRQEQGGGDRARKGARLTLLVSAIFESSIER